MKMVFLFVEASKFTGQVRKWSLSVERSGFSSEKTLFYFDNVSVNKSRCDSQQKVSCLPEQRITDTFFHPISSAVGVFLYFQKGFQQKFSKRNLMVVSISTSCMMFRSKMGVTAANMKDFTPCFLTFCDRYLWTKNGTICKNVIAARTNGTFYSR